MTLPAIVSILDPAFKDQTWTQTDKRNFALVVQGGQVVVGPPIGDLPERRFRDTPTAEGINGILAVLREIHDVFAGTTPITSADIEEFFRLPRYTTAQLTNALATSQGAGAVAFDTTLNRLKVSTGAAWQTYLAAGDVSNEMHIVEVNGEVDNEFTALQFEGNIFDLEDNGDTTVIVHGLVDGSVALNKLVNGSARSIVGRAANSSGAHADIAGNGTAAIPAIASDDGTTIAFRSLSMLGIGLDTFLDQDLTALATNAFTDGSEVVGALTVTVVNTAAAGANWGVVNGTGLRMSGSSGVFSSTTQTGAYFYAALSAFQALGYVPGKILFIDLIVTAGTFTNGNDRMVFGLWGPAGAPAASSSSRTRMAFRGNNGGTQTLGTSFDTTQTAFPDATSPTALSVRIDPCTGGATVGYGTASGNNFPSSFDYVTGNNGPQTAGSNQLASLSTRLTFAINWINTASIDIARWRFRQS